MTTASSSGEDAPSLVNGVFLDLETVDGGDLDRSRLLASLPAWQWHAFSEPEAIAARIAGADVVVTNKCRLHRAALEQAPGLRLIALAATGADNVDLDAAGSLGITVCNIRDYASRAVAQHAIALTLNLLTGQPWYMQDVRDGAWSRSRQFSLHHRPIREAHGLKFGVIGFGVLGRATAALAAALGMEVLIAEHRGDRPRQGRLTFEQVITQADVLSLHCPLNPQTAGLIDRRVLRAMQNHALLVNTARGGIVVEADLAEALRRGEIGGAAVDTLSREPPHGSHALLAADIPNLLVTPHNAWASVNARQAALDQLAEVISAFASGKTINRV